MADWTPLVTVIIPSYNHAQYIDMAITSVLNQDYPNIELIVVDDGSSDNTAEALSKYQGREGITVLFNERNRGQSAVINQVLTKVQGEFVSILPSDDWYLPEKTRLQIEKFQECPKTVGVIYSRGARYFEDTGETVDIDGPMFRGWVADRLITCRNFVYPVTPMFRKECFEKEPLDESFRAEGEAVYVRIALHYQFDYVDQITAVMRDHANNIGKATELMLDEVERFWTKFFQRSDLPDEIRRLRSIPFERLYRTKGLQLIGDSRSFQRGRYCLVKAIQQYPRNIWRWKLLAALGISCLPARIAHHVLDHVQAQRQKRARQ